MIHLIPQSEPELHIEEQTCLCNPVFKMDDKSGEIVWLHQIIDIGKIIDDLIQL